ncbi:MAG: hypothetical protein GF405_09240 [Candidatus Eisenbacteria bacterium]|nr:hypothetical protein [Candidatus Eisenbacteria bacterium]
MRAAASALRLVVLVALCLPLVAGCAATAGGANEEVPSDPKILCDELAEIRNDIANVEELIKGTKAEMNMKEDPNLRSQLRSLEMELYHLRGRERALEEARIEIGATCD